MLSAIVIPDMTCRMHPGDSRPDAAQVRMLGAGVLAAAAALLGAAPLLAANLDPESLGDPLAGRLIGRVHAGDAPLPAARVYIYDIADRSKRATTTDRFGRYAFQPLPAGVYRVIAHRPGFVPAVAELVRTTGESVQSVDFELGARGLRRGAAAADEEDFWSVRERIPNDVLRQIRIAEAVADDRNVALESAARRARFEAELRTLTGIENAGGDAGVRVLGSQFDMRSRYGETRLALLSDLREFERQAFDEERQQLGDSQAFALDVNHRGSNVRITSQRHRFRGDEGADWDDWEPAQFAGLESYGVLVEQAVGGDAARFEARYTSDRNFHHGFGDLHAGQSSVHNLALAAIDSPMSSTTLEFRGGYERQITASTSLEAGLGYRQRQADGSGRLSNRGEGPHERFDLFSQGNWEVQPAVVLEYGVFSTLSDGIVSFTPRAGFVVELGSRWQAAVSASERMDSEHLLFRDFMQVQYHDDEDCTAACEHCYRVALSRRLGAADDRRRVEFGLTERQFADSVRLYFSRDLFERLESLLLVDGDHVAELHFGLQQRLGERVFTRVRTAAATGGGGLLRAIDSRGNLQNQVRYLVASIDTQFERSATGVLLAFRSVEQEFMPHDQDARFPAGLPDSVLSVERLQILLTQGLPRVSATGIQDWSLQLEMQLSRGHHPVESNHDPDQLRRRVVAGLAVRF